MDLPKAKSPAEIALTTKINTLNAEAGTLRADLAKLQAAQVSWQTRDSDFTGLQSQTSYTLGFCHTPYDSYGLRSCQDYLTYYNNTNKSKCSSELDEQTQRLQSLIATKEQQISAVQGNINVMTYQLKTLQEATI